jgi:hypothetical protein
VDVRDQEIAELQVVAVVASYAWGAANVIFVVGAQKLVPTLTRYCCKG